MASEAGRGYSENTFPCRGAIRTLGDEPARKDELGAHEALARAIALLIENEPGGKAIALEGVWGSGKSTAIWILKQALEERHGGRIFVFDGWAHEGDSLRRALIEEFARWAKQEKRPDRQPLVPGEDWRQLDPGLEDLQGRRTEQKSEATYPLKFWGRVMVFLLVLVPIGAVLAARLRGAFLEVGLGLTALPATLLLSVFVLVSLGWIWGRFRSVGPETEAGRWRAFDDVLGIFLRQVEQKTTTTSWSTPEPTSIEFESLFRDVLKKVLGCMEGSERQTKEKYEGKRNERAAEKLVVVLDNLDRLPLNEAMRAFATLRIFLGEWQPEEWMKRFWLLVPYDPGWLRGAARPTRAVDWGIAIAGGSIFTPPAISDDENGASERPFREKFFQAHFRLPQPVLLKWREYLKNRLREALDGHSDDEELLDRIVSLFELVQKNRLPSPTEARNPARYAFPTPREIKFFVNRLATLHMQWPCEKDGPVANSDRRAQPESNIERIPLILQAGFALCEDRVGTDLSASLFPEPNGPRFFRDSEQRLINVSGWEQYVAAMWYGVPQMEAFHMLLRPKLFNAFEAGVVHDGWNFRKEPYEEVQDSGSLGVHGFWDVVPVVAKEFVGTSDGRTLQRCANVMAVLVKWRDEKQPWHAEWRIAWEAVGEDAILALQDDRARVRWEGVLSCGENLALALKTPEATLKLAGAALDALGRMERPPREEDFAQWAKQTVAIMDAMVAKGKPEWVQAVESFKPPEPTQALIFLLGAAYDSPALKGHRLQWADSHDVATLIESMRKTFGDAKLQVPVSLALLYHARTFHWLAWLRPDGPWGPVVEVFPEWFGEGRFVPSVLIPLAGGFLSVLKRLNKNQAWFGDICGKKGHFQNAISRLHDFARTTSDQHEKANAPEAVKALEDILNFLSGSSGDAAS